MKKITEDKLQNDCVIWFTNNYCLKHHDKRGLIFSVPNGGFRDIREAVKLKATGLLAGVSDLIVITPNGQLLFVELKLISGVQSPAQLEFQNRVEALGYKYHLIRSLQDFISIFTN